MAADGEAQTFSIVMYNSNMRQIIDIAIINVAECIDVVITGCCYNDWFIISTFILIIIIWHQSQHIIQLPLLNN